MAKLLVVYNGTGGSPNVFTWCDNKTPDEIEDKISNILSDGCVRVPSDKSQTGQHKCRTIYIIPVHEIIRFTVELSENEDCPEPHD